MGSVSVVVSKLFGLPPVEKRRVIWPFSIKWLQEKFFGGVKSVDVAHDDLYIYYLMMERSFFVAIAVFLPFLISHFIGRPIDLVAFVADATGENFIENAFVAVSKISASIQFGLLFPYYLISFRLRIDPVTFDFRAWNPTPPPKSMSDKKLMWVMFAWFLVMVGLMYSAFALFVVEMEIFHLEKSSVYFVVCGFLLCLVQAWIARFALMAALTSWGYGGRASRS